MKLVRCENGHFYDSEQYTVCPYCSGMDSVGADNVTQPIGKAGTHGNHESDVGC